MTPFIKRFICGLILSLIGVLYGNAHIGDIIGTTVHNGMGYNIISDGTATLFGNLEQFGGDPNFSGPYVIPKSIEYEGKSYTVDCINQAFCNIQGLTTLVIPKNVISIWTSFSYCPNLKQIIFEDGEEPIDLNIGNYSGCSESNIEYCYIGRPITGRQELILLVGKTLKELIISGGAKKFYLTNFESMPNLETVVIDSKLTWPQNGEVYPSFKNCSNLKNVLFTENSLYTWIPSIFSGCKSLSSINIPSTIQGITKRTFMDAPNNAVLVSHAVTPPTLDYYIFPISQDNLIYVPSESVEAYKSDYWYTNYGQKVQNIKIISEPSTISLSKSSISLNIGKTTTITTNSIPNQYIKYWLSSDNKVATVYDGKITAVGPGECDITVHCGSIQSKCHVMVAPLPSSISIQQSDVEINKNESIRLNVSTVPTSIPNLALQWVSSDANIVSVSADGVITGLSAGTATITVYTENNLSSHVNVTVKDPSYRLSLCIPNGSYVIEKLTSPFTFRVTTEDAWEIYSAQFNDEEVDLSLVEDGEFTTPAEMKDYTFSVILKKSDTTSQTEYMSTPIKIDISQYYIHIIGKGQHDIVRIYGVDGICLYQGYDEYIPFSEKGCFVLSIGQTQYKFLK